MSVTTAAGPYYDPYDYEIDANAHAIWKRLRDEAPLYRNEQYDFYAVSRYDDVLRAVLDTDTFSSAHMTVLEMMTPEPLGALGGLMIFMDPPQHTHLRKLVSRAFTPRAIHDLEQRIRRLCAEFLDPFVGSDGFDYIDDFAARLPPTVILALMGFPEGHADEWRKAQDAMFHMEEGEQGFVGSRGGYGNPEERLAEVESSGGNLLQMVPELAAERRRDPKDDLISVLANSDLEEEDGSTRKLRDDEIVGFSMLLSSAGTETVARHLSWAALLLARHPDQRQILVDDPSVIPNALEETLRYEAPSPVNARWVNRDVEFQGQTVPAGSKLLMLNGSGNRDERHFSDPDVYDVRRRIDRHLSFGYGAHFCVGAALARLESRIAMEETLARFPTWKVDESDLGWVHTSTVRGFANVPIHLR